MPTALARPTGKEADCSWRAGLFSNLQGCPSTQPLPAQALTSDGIFSGGLDCPQCPKDRDTTAKDQCLPAARLGIGVMTPIPTFLRGQFSEMQPI